MIQTRSSDFEYLCIVQTRPKSICVRFTSDIENLILEMHYDPNATHYMPWISCTGNNILEPSARCILLDLRIIESVGNQSLPKVR